VFRKISEEVQEHVKTILNKFPNLVEPNKKGEQADPYLIAYAIHESGTVVTEESPLSKKAMDDFMQGKSQHSMRMKIPNVCDHYRIRCINAIEFMNDFGWRSSD